MERPEQLIGDQEVPRASHPQFQHLLDTYASETNKTAAIWSELTDDNLEFRPHSRSSSIRQILVHQILSERRFFAEFIGLREPEADGLLPPGQSPPVADYVRRLVELARPRLGALSERDQAYWLAEVPFFDVRRQRIWVFWRRVLHTAHHRAQVGMCLRLIETRVPSTYGPSADETWAGADPTVTLDAARRGRP